MNLSSDNRTTNSLGTDDFSISFASPISLGDGVWEMSLVSSNFWNSNPNISSTLYNNDYFSYSPDAGVTWKVITLDTGTYNVAEINAETQRQITAYGDLGGNIVISANTATLKVVIETTAPYEVDLGTGSLFYELLGYSVAQIAAPLTGYTTGALRANINRGVNNIYLRSDIVESGGSYDSKIGSDIVTDLAFQGRSPGSSVYIQKPYQLWIPVKRTQYLNDIRIRVTDQLGRRYSLRDEPVNVQFYLRPSKVERERKLFDNFSTGIKGEMTKLK